MKSLHFLSSYTKTDSVHHSNLMCKPFSAVIRICEPHLEPYTHSLPILIMLVKTLMHNFKPLGSEKCNLFIFAPDLIALIVCFLARFSMAVCIGSVLLYASARGYRVYWVKVIYNVCLSFPCKWELYIPTIGKKCWFSCFVLFLNFFEMHTTVSDRFHSAYMPFTWLISGQYRWCVFPFHVSLSCPCLSTKPVTRSYKCH